ncbi:hypothetical protein BS329_15315 [Amycolatopsis coloradensis]|uniref:Uncharacterized protein n=1 Tax=Amycolatopsis coloradensis TaxID=76021 RepID=A0A1R0KU68_9PSEU|nr:hypothetical protein BS329_15315 [Amycolatopsis coloradensis]
MHRRDHIRRRRALTLENHQRAAVEYQQHGVLPSTRPILLGLPQRRLEYDVLMCLGRGTVATDASWPDGTVLGIRSVTPRMTELRIDVHPDAMIPFLHAVLPVIRYTDIETRQAVAHDTGGNRQNTRLLWGSRDTATALGAPYLRPRMSSDGLEFYRLHDDPMVPCRIVLPGITEINWPQLSGQLLGMYAAHEDPVWWDLHWPVDVEGRRYAAGEEARRRGLFHTRSSNLLRRIGLLREHNPRAIAVDTGGFGATGPVFDTPGWPDRRPGLLAVRLDPEIHQAGTDPGPIAWLPAAEFGDPAQPDLIALRSRSRADLRFSDDELYERYMPERFPPGL